ncbi:MAG TPA: hypothetical protein VGC46_07440 [Allosphingosinicella sp.]
MPKLTLDGIGAEAPQGAAVRGLAIIAGLCLGLAASPAAAQLAPSRSGSSTVTYMGAEEAMSELSRFGRCYARERRNDAHSLIATRPSSREEAEVYRRLFNGSVSCIAPGTSLRMPVAYVRGAIAEGLHRVGNGIPDTLRQTAPALAEVRNLSDAARCYAATHQNEVRALLATTAGSRQEFQAVSALMPALSACIPAGAATQFDATVIRFRLAEAQLRLGAPGVSSGN